MAAGELFRRVMILGALIAAAQCLSALEDVTGSATPLTRRRAPPKPRVSNVMPSRRLPR